MTRAPVGPAPALGVLAVAGLLACGRGDRAAPRPAPAEAEAPDPVTIVAGVGWIAEEPLVARPPANELRQAEYAVQGHPGAVLAAFHFGAQEGGGGPVDENVDRWLEQLVQPDGSPTRDRARIEQRQSHGLPITTVSAEGTFVGQRGTAPSVGQQPGWRLLGAIIEGPEGPVFLKLTGPREAVGLAEAAFEALLASVHPA